jgi:uncharacterized membrane protein
MITAILSNHIWLKAKQNENRKSSDPACALYQIFAIHNFYYDKVFSFFYQTKNYNSILPVADERILNIANKNRFAMTIKSMNLINLLLNHER